MIKQTAASPDLLQHRGRAYVFETRDRDARRDRTRRSAGGSRHGAGDAQLRTQRRAGFSGMGPHPDAAQTAQRRRRRYGAHLRRAHERHIVRNGGAACRSRIGHWRPAGASRDRRRNSARCSRHASWNCWSRPRNWIAARGFSNRLRAITTAATGACSWTTLPKPIWVAISIFSARIIAEPSALLAALLAIRNHSDDSAFVFCDQIIVVFVPVVLTVVGPDGRRL